MAQSGEQTPLISEEEMEKVASVVVKISQQWAQEKRRLASIVLENVSSQAKLDKLCQALLEIQAAPPIQFEGQCGVMAVLAFAHGVGEQRKEHDQMLRSIGDVIRSEGPSDDAKIKSITRHLI